KSRLEKRKQEILEQLNGVNESLRTELDNDGEEQAIQIEQEEVAIAQERNLRKELAVIEDELAGS
ncbi:MAG TPA: hypothetical protein VGQ55_15555, partial [Pyrinomonadaceae bacterium]|nr:hypothetical protein [Pyrinomonadaceae bacterium]